MNTTPIVLTGRVSDATGKPVALARIYFADGPDPLPEIALLTDAGGNFSMSVPRPGDYKLGCSADGFATVTVPVNLTNNQNSPVMITLTK